MVTNFTANKLTVNTLKVERSGIVNVTDTLKADKIQLYASNLTAGTIITSGDIGNDFLNDHITVTTGNLTARNVKGLDITVEKNCIATGDVRVYDRVTVNGDLTAKNVTALGNGITVGGKLVANNVDAQNTNNSADGGKITADSIDATGNVTAKDDVNVTNNLKANNVTAKTIKADSINATGDVSASETLDVNNILAANNVTSKTIEMNSLNAKGNVTASDGDVTVKNNLTAKDVTGKTITANSINATGNVTASEGNVTVTNSLAANDVTGNVIKADSINATGDISASETLDVNNILAANNVTSKTIEMDSLNAKGNVTASDGDVKVTNNLAAKDVTGKTISADSINATGNVSAGENVTVTGDLKANDVTGKNITAASITADTVTASERVSVADTLSVTKSLNTPEAAAKTVILSKGATAAGNITTDTLQVDPSTAAAALSHTTVKAATAGSAINIADADGFAITNQNLLASIAAAAGLSSGSYTSMITEAGRQNIPGMVDRIGMQNPFETKLFDIASLGDLPDLAKWKAQFAQAYRTSEPVRALVNATANAGAAATQAVTGAFTLGAATRTADLRAGAPASAVVDKGAESDVSSLWLSIKGGETKVDGGDYADTRVRVTTYQAGYDFQLSDVDFLGVFFGTASGYAQTQGAYSQRVDIKHAMNYGLYGTHAFRHGQYLDYMLQGGPFDNKIQGQEMWGTKSYGGSLGYGWKYRTQSKRHEFTWNPYVSLKYDHIATDARTIAGNEIATDDANNLSMKLGLNVTTDFGLYAGLAYSRGLAGSLASYVNSFAMPEDDFDDSVFYVNLGYKGNVNENTLFNVNLEKTFGDYDGWAMEGRVDFLL